MATGIHAHVTSTPAVIATAGLSGTELVFGPLGTTALYLGGSDLESDGSKGWNAPASGTFTVRLGVSEKLYGVVPSGSADITFLSTNGGLA